MATRVGLTTPNRLGGHLGRMTDTCNYIILYAMRPNKARVSLLNNIITNSLPVFLMSAQTHSSAPSPSSSVVKDVALWRRKSLTATILIAATATWTLIQVYQFHFVTLFSWLVMFVVASAFLWTNMLRLFGKLPPSLLNLELPEESALKMAYVARAWIEEGIRLLFRVSAQEDWSLFLGAVVGLFVLSYVASNMDLLTLLYIGTLTSTTVPVIYDKNQNRIKSSVEWLRVKCKRVYQIFDERAIQKIKRRVINNDENEMKRANEKKAQ